MRQTKETANIAWNGQPSAGEALSDRCMKAAESFCGMEQMTPRVKPVEALAGTPDGTGGSISWNPG